MIKQKGIIHFTVLLGITVIVAIALMIYFSRKSDYLSIMPPSLSIFSAYLNTIDGRKILHKESFSGLDQKGEEIEIGRIRSQLGYYNSFLQDAIISLQQDKIYFYDKNTKKLKILPLPEEVKKLKNDSSELFSLELFAEELSEKSYLINFSHNQKDHYTYLLSKEDTTLYHLRQFDDECKYIFCGGPRILKRISDNDFIFIQGAGDACWEAGAIHKFSLKTEKTTKLFDYSNGCSVEFDAYFGMYEESFIRAKHRILESYNNAGVGPDQEILEIYLSDINGLDKVLIPRSVMPSDIDYILLNSEHNLLYLYRDSKSKYYEFDIKTSQLKSIDKDQIEESKVNIEDTGKVIEQNADFLTIEITEGNIGSIDSVYVSGQSINIKDSYGNRVRVLADSFLDKVKFDKEEKECLYEKIPVSLDYKIFPFRFSSHEYEDSAKVLNGDEIMFVVLSECNEYPSGNGRPSKWFLGAKQFVLNIRTGKIILKAELEKGF